VSQSRHLVDPQLLPLLDAFPTMAFSAELLPQIRSRVLPIVDSGVGLETVAVSERTVPGPKDAPDVGVVIYQPKAALEAGAAAVGCIFHVHGGGYVTGRAKMEARHRPLAHTLGCAIVSVDYRLAPETPAPGSVEDCYAALKWVLANAEELGIDPARIGVMGESAGGGMGAALALLVRDRGEITLAFQHLIYPMLDDRTCTAADPHPHVGDYIWTRHNNHFGWSALLGHEPGIEGVSPYAAPARAGSLAGLPPTFISTGALDLFLEEDMDYARRLTRAGVPVEFHIYPGGFHAFDIMPTAEVSMQARRDSEAALRRALG
jgi:triacylglycerol lipase